MVYIKSLICEGFKSFKHRTKIDFSKGFTSIVGANGSGKSNILDAFVFALGELSGNKLRVNNIKDLICNGGTHKGAPSNWARVDIVFDNSERTIPINSNVVKISRKVNIKRQGKYYINDKATTRRELQDIMDLAGLIPNSSNLILQGELFRIINMNNNERRELIEDISGIASYNEKKEAAEKDLVKIEENISRITILLNELSFQLDSLEKERNEALEYNELDIEQKKAEKASIILKIRDFEKKIKKIKTKKQAFQDEIEEINNKLIEKREHLMQTTINLDDINTEIKKLQSSELKELTMKLNDYKTTITKKETQQESHSREIERLKKNLIKTFRKKESNEEEKKTIKEKLIEKKQRKSEVKIKLLSLKEELFHGEAQIKEFDSENLEFQQKLDSIINKIDEKNLIKNDISSDIKVLKNKLENSNRNLNNVRVKNNKLNQEIIKIKDNIKDLIQNEKKHENISNKVINIEDLEKEKTNINQNLKKLQKGIDDKYTKLISMRSKIKAVQKFSSNKAITAILKLKDNPEVKEKHKIRGKIYDTVAQLGKANQEYNTALQVAGGAKFNYIIVDNQSTAKQCINYLKKNNIGRASFIPLDKIKANPIILNVKLNENVIGRAVDLIEFNPVFTKAFEFIFGRSIVVSDINTAIDLNLSAKRITLAGDVIESSNLMTGGKRNQQSQGGFRAIEELKIPLLERELENLRQQESEYIKQLKQIEKEITSHYKRKISLNKELGQVKQNLAIFNDKLAIKQEELNELEPNIQEFESEINAYEHQIQEEQQKLDDIREVLNELKAKERDIKAKISMLKNNDFTKKINGLRTQIDTLEKDKMKIELEITKLETQLEEIVNNREKEIENDIQKAQEEIENYTSELKTIKNELIELNQATSELEAEVMEKNQVIGQLYTKKDELLQSQTSIKLKIDDLKSNIHPISLKINTLKNNLDNFETQKNILEQTSKIADVDIDSIQEFLNYSQDKLNSIIEESLSKKHLLEPVNMRAIKKYAKIKRRYDDLIEKHEIVVNERQAILEFIEKIELEKKKTFMDAFNGINKHFREIFSKLSPGGEAKLELENPEEPFMGGVKMLARPGGKKWCITQSMSGGEKTLTVVALVLGIQIYLPSPYYILDEIDASFDDYNASQVASLIKDLSKKSQFILITHRDVTMTKTDQLLGVSNVNGLTSIINLNIHDALEQIAQA